MTQTTEVASQYGVHPVQVAQWKRQALAALPEAFASRRARAAEEAEALQARLYQEIGQLKVELDWLKRKAGWLAGAEAGAGRVGPPDVERRAPVHVARAAAVELVLPA